MPTAIKNRRRLPPNGSMRAQAQLARAADIPRYNPHQVRRVKFRWTADQAFSNYHCSPLYACLFHAICLGAGAYGNLWPLYGAVRFRRIELWGATTQSGTPATVSVVQMNTTTAQVANFGLGPNLTDTTINSDVPAHVVWNFNSALFKNWFGATDGTFLFDICGPAGCVIELELDVILNTQAAVASAVATTAIPTNPTIGFSPFDLGNTPGLRKLKPDLGGSSNPVWS